MSRNVLSLGLTIAIAVAACAAPRASIEGVSGETATSRPSANVARWVPSLPPPQPAPSAAPAPAASSAPPIAQAVSEPDAPPIDPIAAYSPPPPPQPVVSSVPVASAAPPRPKLVNGCPEDPDRPRPYRTAAEGAALFSQVERGWSRAKVLELNGPPTRCEGLTWVYVAGPPTGPEVTYRFQFGRAGVIGIQQSSVGCRIYD